MSFDHETFFPVPFDTNYLVAVFGVSTSPAMYAEPWHSSIVVERKDDTKYEVTIHNDHTTGLTVSGGSMGAAIWKVVDSAFRQAHKQNSHPHILHSHCNFLRTARAGELMVEVEVSRSGRQLTAWGITISQHGQQIIRAHCTSGDLSKSFGPTIATEPMFTPSVPAADLAALSASGEDANWLLVGEPYHAKQPLKSWTYMRFAIPKARPVDPSITDIWVTPSRPGTRITQDWLPYIIDFFTRPVENYLKRSPYSIAGLLERGHYYNARGCALPIPGDRIDEWVSTYEPPFGFPTQSIDIDVQKLLPKEGVDWLFLRAKMTVAKNGRAHYDVVVLDELGDVVALSNQIGLIVPTTGMTGYGASRFVGRDSKL